MGKESPSQGVSAATLGRHLDLSRQRIMQLRDEEIIHKLPDGTFDQDACRISYLRWLRSEERRASKSVAESGLRAARQREVELRVAMMDRRLIDIDEHDAILDEVVGAVREKFGAMPARYARDPGRQRQLEDAVNTTLCEIADLLEQRGRELRSTGSVADVDEVEP